MLIRLQAALVLVSATLGLPCSASAQRNWVQSVGAAHPTALLAFDMVYDVGRDRTVLFGGRSHNPNAVLYDETWEFDGAVWTQRFPVHHPGPRAGCRMALAPGGGVMVYGGHNGGPLAETWTWDGVDWTQHMPLTSPPPMHEFAMWFDFARNRTVLFNGETWAWNGVDWTQLFPQTSPPPLYETHGSYDMMRDRAVVFGGRINGIQTDQTWEFDGFEWQQRMPPTVPAARWGMKLTFDLFSRRTIMHGGYTAPWFVAETWEWDGYDWHQIVTPVVATGRNNHSIAFDWAREQVLIYGGYPPDDGWIYVQESEGRFTPLGYGCAGANGVPSLTAAPGTVPLGGQTFDVQLGNLPTQAQVAIAMLGLTELPGVSLAPIGLPGCHQFVSPDVAVWVTAANGAATLPLTFPASPALQGAQFYLQAVVPDAGANQLGLTVSSAAACTIG